MEVIFGNTNKVLFETHKTARTVSFQYVDVNAYYKESSIVANPVQHNLNCELTMCDDGMPLHRCTR